MFAKVGLGVVGLGAIGMGGVAFTKPEWLGINKEIPWTPLSEDSDFTGSNSEYTGKFGSTYKNYLVGATENQDWWNKIFDQLKKDSQGPSNIPSDKFKHTSNNSKVTEGFSTTNKTTALNQICKKVYKSEESKIDTSGTGADKYKDEDVWKYCSPFGGKLKTVKDVDNKDSGTPKYGGNTMGKTKKDVLISVTGTTNDKFWEIRNKEFQDTGDNSLTSGDEESYFAKNKNGKTIKELCGEVYDKEAKSTAPKVEATTVVKYCSLKGTDS